MNKQASHVALAALVLVGGFAGATTASAQVAGGTTSLVETTQLALGWSVKKSLMGKPIYNDAGTKVGKVEDLIISPDKNLTYVIVGAGGFVGIGRHDVAVPVSQIQDHAGKLVMAGATKDAIKAMPQFAYVNDSAKRDLFIATAEKDIARGRTRQAELEQRAGVAATEAKGKINGEIATLQADVKSAEARLDEMKGATAARWKEFEVGVSAATAKLRKSIETATG